MTPFSFMLDWELNCQFAGLVWAKTNGWYENVGLDVRLVPPSRRSSAPVLDAVLETPLSAGCMEDNLIVRACADDVPIRAVAAMLQETPMVLMSADDAGIRTLAHLPGHRVGVHEDGVHLLETILSLHEVDPASVELAVGGWTLDDLVRGRLDAVQGYAITEPACLEAAGFRPHLIPVAHRRLQPYAQMMFATTDCIRKHTQPLARFLRTTFAGWREVLANPERAARYVAAVSAEHSEPALNVRIIERMRSIVQGAMPLEHLGALDPERWRRNLSTYEASGMVSRAPCLDEIMEDGFLARVSVAPTSDRQSRRGISFCTPARPDR